MGILSVVSLMLEFDKLRLLAKIGEVLKINSQTLALLFNLR